MRDEDRRLAALQSYLVLDTPPEPQFDDVVQIARSLCSAPIALVSLVDADRQWFKARSGLDACETPLSQSVCAYAIREDEILVIPDLTLDPRTRENTLVTEGPCIRFYAGAVLRTPEGEALGALCVIDDKPRPEGLTAQQAAALCALARQTMILLHYRRGLRLREAAVRQSSERVMAVESAQRAGGVGTFEIDVRSDALLPSPEFCRIFGLPYSKNRPASDVEMLTLSTDRDFVSNRASRTAGTSPLAVEYQIRRADDGEARWIARRASFERDEAGKAIRLRGVVYDVTERKLAEAGQHTLNQELSHRMKNTLAMVDAIANQTLRGAADKEAVETFSRRILALGKAHDILLQQSMLGASIRPTITGVVGLHGDADRFDLEGPDLDINARSVLSFSLLIHELSTNAAKYGALSRSGGRVIVTWRIDAGARGPQLVLCWQERGGPLVAAPTRRGFGSRLIQAGLAGTGDADIRYEIKGLVAEFRAPLSNLTTM